MPLTPEDVKARGFSVVYGRGYSREEVDEFLARVSVDYGTALQRVSEAVQADRSVEDDFSAAVAEVLNVAQESAKRMRAKARSEADTIVEDAKTEARRVREDAHNFELKAKERAETEAKKVIEDAQAHAREVKDSADREKLAKMAIAQERYGALLEHEKDLRDRIGTLEQLVSEMRKLIDPLERIDLRGFEIGEMFTDDEMRSQGLVATNDATVDAWQIQKARREGARAKGDSTKA